MPGKYIAFSVCGYDGDVYVTIKTKTRRIADNFPIKNDHSIIVDADGCVRNTKEDSIWTDAQGVEHAH